MEGKKILLVDDQRKPEWIDNPDADIPEYAFTVKYKPDDVHVCRTTEQGLEDIVKRKWDILLLDHDMGPGKSGMHMLYFLLDEDNIKHMPNKIYLVTANIISGPLMYEILDTFKKEGKIEDYRWIR